MGIVCIDLWNLPLGRSGAYTPLYYIVLLVSLKRPVIIGASKFAHQNSHISS
jgi:hypothetical protein